ncbi:hypothetical protein FD754_015440, partial [Muntiacus muntjak]
SEQPQGLALRRPGLCRAPLQCPAHPEALSACSRGRGCSCHTVVQPTASFSFCVPAGVGIEQASFTRQVLWKLLKLVKFGETVSYQQLAALAGNPRAARAVGGAMRSNPIPILIPCHRVVCSSGAVGNYSGGVGVKEWLLAHEGSPAGKAARGGGSRAARSWRGALGGTASSQPTGRD